MTPLVIILIIVAVLIVGGAVFSFFYCRKVAKVVYETTLVRTSPEKWGRCCSAPENEEQLAMWNAGCAWADAHKDKMTEVEIENDGFHLYGEYYDFGCKRAVIIIPGRSESLMYSYFFAPPYEKAGCNVFVIDIRSHGKSDGVYDYIGVGEDRDTMKWAELLHDRFGNEQVLIHGICMGAGTGILILSRPDYPKYIAGQISEGCYISFYESYKRHMIEQKRPTFPVLPMVMSLIKKHTGTDVSKTKPIDYIDKVKVPFLFICGEKDPFSLPEKSRELFAKCGSDKKEIVWFPTGNHSHLRFSNTEGFDQAIIDFVHKYFD
ncbi:MAG: alpha/beta hydrolase [Lachnospiraceae bacterium]|nr:alpha/beta hydrolase [Lachnospiraceae bacterium]